MISDTEEGTGRQSETIYTKAIIIENTTLARGMRTTREPDLDQISEWRALPDHDESGQIKSMSKIQPLCTQATQGNLIQHTTGIEPMTT